MGVYFWDSSQASVSLNIKDWCYLFILIGMLF